MGTYLITTDTPSGWNEWSSHVGGLRVWQRSFSFTGAFTDT